MLFYTLLLGIISLGGIISYTSKIKNKEIFFLVFSFIILFFVSGLRNNYVGADTATYISTFNIIKNIPLSQSFELYFESGYILYNYVIGLFFDNAQFLIIISSFIIIIAITTFIYKNSANVYMSLYLFITLMFYYDSMNIMRQFLAVSVILYGFEFVKSRKFIKYLVCVIIATFLHTTAIISILIYFLYSWQFSYKRIFLLFICSLVGYSLLNPILIIVFELLPRYASYETRLGSNNFASYIAAFMYFVIVLFGLIILRYDYSKSKKYQIGDLLKQNDNLLINDNTNSYIYSPLTYIMVITTVLNFLAIEFNILGRADIYFSIFVIIYLPNVINKIKNKNIKFLSYFFILIFCTLYNIIIFLLRPDWHWVIPYEFFFN